MAPLPDNLTGRMFIDYNAVGQGHTAMVRFAGGLSSQDVLGQIGPIFNLIADGLQNSFAVTGVRRSEAGSNISLPIDYSGTLLDGLTGGLLNALAPHEAAREMRWVGRSLTSGRRVSFSLYGGIFSMPGNFRLGPGEHVGTSSQVIAALNAASSVGVFVAADGTRVSWKPYANVNFNSYWEGELRS